MTDRRNTEYHIEVGAPLLRPGMTIRQGPVSEKYVVEETRKVLDLVRQINRPEEREPTHEMSPPFVKFITGGTHELKIWPEPFEAVHSGKKRYELRKADRDFKVGDGLFLREWDPNAKDYTGRSMKLSITYITPGGEFGLPEDFCILSIAPPY